MPITSNYAFLIPVGSINIDTQGCEQLSTAFIHCMLNKAAVFRQNVLQRCHLSCDNLVCNSCCMIVVDIFASALLLASFCAKYYFEIVPLSGLKAI